MVTSPCNLNLGLSLVMTFFCVYIFICGPGGGGREHIHTEMYKAREMFGFFYVCGLACTIVLVDFVPHFTRTMFCRETPFTLWWSSIGEEVYGYLHVFRGVGYGKGKVLISI